MATLTEFDPGNPEPVSTTYYYYNFDGNVTRVVSEQAAPDPGAPRYSATWLTANVRRSH